MIRDFSTVISVLCSVLAVVFWMVIADTSGRVVGAVLGITSLAIMWTLRRTAS